MQPLESPKEASILEDFSSGLWRSQFPRRVHRKILPIAISARRAVYSDFELRLSLRLSPCKK